jgi:hypothetical protein
MPATKPNPISLTDDQLSTVMKAAEPLDPARRSAFLVALASMLRSEPQPVGDGSLGRAIRALQHEFRDPMCVGTSLPIHSRRKVGSAIACSSPAFVCLLTAATRLAQLPAAPAPSAPDDAFRSF